MADIPRKPAWLKGNKRGAATTQEVRKILRKYHLHSVCESAACPNRGECFERKTATFMILGDVCTRHCKFCAINKTKILLPPDPIEPSNIALVAKELNLKHVVITTVTRDDLADGGAAHFCKVIQAIRTNCERSVSIEVLISDLNGDLDAAKSILSVGPDVFNHNVETVPRLYVAVRPEADYQRSLKILEAARDYHAIISKSGIMVGLGEKKEEVVSLMKDLHTVGVQILTIGQYLAPSKQHFPIYEYVHPDTFNKYKEIGLKIGFKIVESSPLVRSSYHAEKARELLTGRE